ncbi:hypothetical protein Bcav_0460 [Beutenbergia cavernae DSM 12333]|uniref:DUF4352 domain-containing protein n=1 Tax=Beutenbergia cavernae (strain ATCC BAA-8 / DSM 12333 / CCUG 43141 / JCM 11478 / NBRC 16432 / NCIMB 13614 / HKI 0122) TaxID=471853 RepID=C5BX48_BEUC1|nr:hypothetical protein [Beutenbergia cavernae]ACQ78723.1 hypothetical protein Bcav_0460 [Beutenbergia cavernae DSM 12333]
MSRRRWARRGVVVLLAVLVTFTGWLHNQRSTHPPAQPRAATGAVGEDVTAYPLVVHVTGARAARLLTYEEFDGPMELDSGGAWVGVTLSYAGIDTPVLPSGFELRDAQGRTFSESDRVDVMTRTAQPDEFFRTEIVFEVPTGALDGDLLLRALPSGEVDIPMWIAEIPLGRVEVDDAAPLEPVEGEFLPVGER